MYCYVVILSGLAYAESQPSARPYTGYFQSQRYGLCSSAGSADSNYAVYQFSSYESSTASADWCSKHCLSMSLNKAEFLDSQTLNTPDYAARGFCLRARLQKIPTSEDTTVTVNDYECMCASVYQTDTDCNPSYDPFVSCYDFTTMSKIDGSTTCTDLYPDKTLYTSRDNAEQDCMKTDQCSGIVDETCTGSYFLCDQSGFIAAEIGTAEGFTGSNALCLHGLEVIEPDNSYSQILSPVPLFSDGGNNVNTCAIGCEAETAITGLWGDYKAKRILFGCMESNDESCTSAKWTCMCDDTHDRCDRFELATESFGHLSPYNLIESCAYQKAEKSSSSTPWIIIAGVIGGFVAVGAAVGVYQYQNRINLHLRETFKRKLLMGDDVKF